MAVPHKYSQTFEKIFTATRKICDLIGLDIVNKDFKFSWRTFCLFGLINAGIGLCFNTIYVDIIIKGNYYYLFKTGSIIGTAIQGYTKAITVLRNKNNVRFLYEEIKEIYEIYEQKSSPYKNALKMSISLVKKLMGTALLILVITITTLIILPIITLIFFDMRIEILPYLIPFLDYETDLGYYLTSCTHIVCLFVAGFGNLVSDSWLFIYVGHVPLMKIILKCKFDELDEVINKNPNDFKKSSGPVREILQWHQKCNVFCKTIKETFFWIIFVQISTEFFGIACCIVCTFLGVWPPAPLFGFYIYSTIFAYCSLGNLMESANDDITIMIYDCCWYNLPVSEQKKILIMLRESQQATGISIGGVSPLSLNTALQLTKTIYTFSMMLKEFFN